MPFVQRKGEKFSTDLVVLKKAVKRYAGAHLVYSGVPGFRASKLRENGLSKSVKPVLKPLWCSKMRAATLDCSEANMAVDVTLDF